MKINFDYGQFNTDFLSLSTRGGRAINQTLKVDDFVMGADGSICLANNTPNPIKKLIFSGYGRQDRTTLSAVTTISLVDLDKIDLVSISNSAYVSFRSNEKTNKSDFPKIDIYVESSTLKDFKQYVDNFSLSYRNLYLTKNS